MFSVGMNGFGAECNRGLGNSGDTARWSNKSVMDIFMGCLSQKQKKKKEIEYHQPHVA